MRERTRKMMFRIFPQPKEALIVGSGTTLILIASAMIYTMIG